MYVRALRRINNDSLEADLASLNMWIQCDKPISGVVHGLKCATKTKYRHFFTFIEKKKEQIY